MSGLRPLGSGWEPLVVRAAEALVTSIEPEAVAKLRGWLDAIATWNARIDLTAARDAKELVDLMVADALVLSAATPAGARVVDVGSGAGAPGLGIAILRPDLRVRLVEPLQKRVAFLRTVLGTLGLPNATVLRDRGEALADRGERFDVAIARATLPPPEWLALGARLAAPGGSVWVLLAREPAPTLPDWACVEDRAYRWPHTQVERRALRYQRTT